MLIITNFLNTINLSMVLKTLFKREKASARASSDRFLSLSLSLPLSLWSTQITQNQHPHIQNPQPYIPKEFSKNSQKIPKEFPKNSLRIP